MNVLYELNVRKELNVLNVLNDTSLARPAGLCFVLSILIFLQTSGNQNINQISNLISKTKCNKVKLLYYDSIGN